MNSPASQPSDPRPALTAALQGLFADLAGLAVADVSPQASFLELGLDSLTLTQASQAIHKRYGVRVPMRQLLESCPDVDSLAEQLQAQMSPQALAAFVPAVASPAASMPSDSPAPAITVAHLQPAAMTDGSPQQTPVAVTALSAHPRAEAWGPLPVGTAAGWMELMAQQLAVMSRQLEVMRGAPLASALAMQPAGPAQPLTVPQRVAPAPPVAVPQTEAAMSPGLNPGSLAAQPEPAPSATADKAAPTAGGAAFGPYRPPVTRGQAALTEAQREALRRFIDDYSTRTAGSKRATQDHRAHLADPRSVAGFRMAWKELVYPLVTVRSAGSRLWDVDGHEYIDITNGFGMILFGHNPAFVRDAVQAQLEAGYEIGPQTPLAGEVAQALCEMTGMERAAFCGSGSEAVTAAIRVARTVTGRDTIVMFNGAYHGIFDEVLVRPGQALAASGADASALAAVNRSLPPSIPIAPGIPQAMADNIVVLEYGSPQALPTIKSLGPRLAAVLVEPVQSRRPDLQPREFLHELRALTSECGAALVFDEVVTGFRVHPGGAQAVFGVKADIATYGKVLGGGLPIGAVAGSARFMDALDGGAWQFGDDSAPEVGVTFFAGTFVRHPLALAAARAVLRRLKAEGPQLQRELNLRTTRFVESLRAMAQTMGAPLQVPHFASWFCLQLPSELPLAPLFFAALRLRGVHVWEGRPCFLTLAHTDDDLRTLIEAVRGALLDMQLHGFLPSTPTALPQAAAAPMSAADEPPLPGARRGHDPQGREAWFVPDPQRPGKYLQIRNESTSHG